MRRALLLLLSLLLPLAACRHEVSPPLGDGPTGPTDGAPPSGRWVAEIGPLKCRGPSLIGGGVSCGVALPAPDPGAGIVSLTPADPMELQALCATKGGQIATICLYPALVSPQIILTNPSPGAASCSQGKAVGGTVDCSGSGDRATSAYPGPKETNAFIGTCEGGPASVRAFCIAGELVSDTLSTYVHQVATSDETLAQCPDEKPVTIGGGCRSTNNKPVWQSRPVALGNDRWGWKCSGGKPDAYAVCAAITSQQQGS